MRVLRGLKDPSELAKLIREETTLGALTDLVWDEVTRLQSAVAATSSELQSKFAGSIELSYQGLDAFSGGLEGIVGPPHPQLLDAIKADHTEGQGTESTDEFVTDNYGVWTSSKTEFLFVYDPEATPEQLNLDHWPKESEEKLLDRSRCRIRRPLADILAAARSPNWALKKAKQPELIDEELVAANLYTGPVCTPPLTSTAPMHAFQERGTPANAPYQQFAVRPHARHGAEPMYNPAGSASHECSCALSLVPITPTSHHHLTAQMFVKYNGVLRGISDKAPPFLKNLMITLCCPRLVADNYEGRTITFADAKRSLNKYATTLHGINSSIIKLGKLTKATKIYHGISGKKLPDEFWKPNEFDMRGGVESAFMSTTLNKEVAMGYASGDSSRMGIIIEVKQGMVNRGADISWLSQYPHEQVLPSQSCATLDSVGSYHFTAATATSCHC